MSENGHNNNYDYDGIVEHNNPMPTWWTWIFIVTVCFAFIYFLHYEVTGSGASLKQELATAMQKIEQIRAESASKFVDLTGEALEKKLKDPNVIQLGAATFQAKCAMCHGEKLEGKIGPNLTDSTWINGTGLPNEILATIRTGVAAKGMPPWEGVLKPDELYGVLALITSKKQ
jgi:cytochrome c oxidase cbb3-type subunit 3